MFQPKRIQTKEEMSRIAGMLEVFYLSRPDSYGLLDRDQSEYVYYANAIKKWTESGGRVLDLGCGTYRTPKLIHEYGYETIGCDLFSDEKLKEYRKILGKDGPRLMAYKGGRLPFENHSFDTVATLCVLEHVTDVYAMLGEMSRVLKPGGHMVIVGPNLSGPHRSVKGWMHLAGGEKRFWQYSNGFQCLGGLFRTLGLTLKLALSGKPEFVYIYPLNKNGQILFEQPDDDAIHLNLPMSYKNWFRKAGFSLREYNNRVGDSRWTRIFNRFFPSFATKLHIVARKSLKQSAGD